MSFFWILLGFLVAVSSRWAYSYFGLSCFEQLVFHVKVPLEGTNTQFIFDWIKKCFLKSLIVSFILCWLPELWAKFIFIACLCYAIMQIQIISYIAHQFMHTDVYDRLHSVEVKSPKKKMNLIHIYLESMETTYAKQEHGGNSKEDLLPFLTQLTEDNISFSNTDKIGGARVLNGSGWTTGGIVSSSCGIPLIFNLKHKFCNDDVPFLENTTSLGDILSKDGYKQVYMIGSNAKFGGRKFFYKQHGNFEILDIDELKRQGKLDQDYHEFWGFEDDKLFAFAKEELTQLSKLNQPFNFTMLTVDTHHPYGYQSKNCKNQFKESLSNSIAHTDELLKDFMNWLKQQDFYENTVVVIQGDHTSMAAEYIHDTYDSNYERRVWNTFIHSQAKPVRTKNRDFTTFDLFPTILAALGYKIKDNKVGLGTNLFSEEKTLTETIQADKLNIELTKQSKKYQELI
ncbi:LTA synthase family protein [Floccifex sp.]|uniref:LTA synthase family protein n=1 Tax=Floccifex sp. TaxID=2815810 RepID=UPI002A751CCF|nr:LTA synthase family protein [Floccifex sp.]MDD7281886.1 LTA synthase family protein [Erysipelotrichaceae bacterium]MDY2958603.1 LTA synthase family protein [Floccifex sp.]